MSRCQGVKGRRPRTSGTRHLGTLAPGHLLPAFAFPIGDWQFWVVTGVFLVALGWMLRGVLPVPFFSKRARAKKKIKRVSLTVEGKAPGK